MTISPDTRSLALEALTEKLDWLRLTVRGDPLEYAKDDWRGEIHRRRMASRIRSVRAAIRELDALPWERVA